LVVGVVVPPKQVEPVVLQSGEIVDPALSEKV
jgi:hypothetical protein